MELRSSFGIADCKKLMEEEKLEPEPVFDPSAKAIADPAHSAPGDERFVNIGTSTKNRLLFVVHNEADGVIRIISARLATPAQRELYEES